MALTVADFLKMKADHVKFTMLTTYDATFAHLVETAGIEMILIGDSLGNTMQGRGTTVGVSLDDVIYHSQCVMRGCTRPFVVCDMPFGSYQVNDDEGMRSAIRIMAEGGVHAVKLEGGARCVPLVKRLVEAGIPVVAHLGLTPQSVNTLSGYRVQGKNDEQAEEIYRDALALEEAGAFAIVLECVPRGLAKRITESLKKACTIGIGAGPDCDAQVLVLQDALGMSAGKKAKFVRTFANVGEVVTNALAQYVAEVKEGTYPSDAESYH